MKKLLLLITVVLFGSGLLFGQSFEIVDEDGVTIQNGATINLTGEATTNMLKAHLFIKNTTDEVKNVYVKKVILQDVENTFNTFCWAESCFPPDVFQSPKPDTVQPNSLSNYFDGDFQPNGNEGIVSIMYVWFDEMDINDSVYVFVNFNTNAEKKLAISNDMGEFVDGKTIQIEGTNETSIVMDKLRVINFKDNASSVKVLKMINEGDTIPGSTNSFYWGGMEYPVNVYESDPVSLESKATSYDFAGNLYTNETSGISTISYKFYDENDPDDNVMLTVEFNAKTSDIIENRLVEISNAYPNPADKTVYFNIKSIIPGTEARIIIRNLLGEVVKEQNIFNSSKTVNFNVSDLNEGLYVYSLIINDKVTATRKLVVRH